MAEVDAKSNNLLLYVLLAGCLASILVSFYSFYYKQDYDFIVEVPCDISKEICFQRDCGFEGNCPPNNLSNFKRYSLSANNFGKCENEDCTEACESGRISCEPVVCQENLEVGESCSILQSSL